MYRWCPSPPSTPLATESVVVVSDLQACNSLPKSSLMNRSFLSLAALSFALGCPSCLEKAVKETPEEKETKEEIAKYEMRISHAQDEIEHYKVTLEEHKQHKELINAEYEELRGKEESKRELKEQNQEQSEEAAAQTKSFISQNVQVNMGRSVGASQIQRPSLQAP